jgi:hypothetical protein
VGVSLSEYEMLHSMGTVEDTFTGKYKRMGHKVRESPTEHGQIEPDRTLLRVKSVPE